MKILFHSAYPIFTGSQTIALQIAIAARDAGHEILATAPGEMEFLERAAAEGLPTEILPMPEEFLQFGKAMLAGSRWSKVKFLIAKMLPCSFRTARLLRKWKVDVIYAAQERAVVQVGIAARLARKPILWHIQGGLLSESNWIYKMIDRLSTRRVCVSNAVAGTVVDALGPSSRERLTVIHNGIPDIESEQSVASESSGEDSGLKLLYGGAVIPDKGVHHLIVAFAGLNGDTTKLTLRIAGRPKNENYHRYLKDLIEKNQLQERVEFLGYREDLPDLIRSADVVVCPSIEKENLQTSFGNWTIDWKEGFCLVALEAMRASKAVIASDSYGLKEVVADGDSGLRVPPGDPVALKDAIQDLADHPDRRRELGIKGRQRYLDQFSLESMTRAFLGEFDALLKQ